MASHHKVSDALQDRWPILPAVREDGSKTLTVAYGPRRLSKLADRLASEELSDGEVAHCLRLLRAELVDPLVWPEALEVGLLEISLHVLATSAEGSTRELAAGLITQVLGSAAARTHFASLEGLAALCARAGKDPDAGVRCEAARAFEVYTSSCDGQADIVRVYAPVLPLAVAALRVSPYMVHALARLVSAQPLAVPLLLFASIMEPVVHIAQNADAKHTAQLHDALITLRALVHDDKGKELALSLQAVPALLPGMSSPAARTCLVAVGALAMLTVPLEGKRTLLQPDNARVLDAAMRHLSHPDMAVVTCARAVLNNVAAIPEGRLRVTRALVAHQDHYVQVFGFRAIHDLIAMLEEDAPRAVTASLGVLSALLQLQAQQGGHRACSAGIMDSLHAQDNLASLATGAYPNAELARAGVVVPPADAELAAHILSVVTQPVLADSVNNEDAASNTGDAPPAPPSTEL